MKPILYKATETEFRSNGLGVLAETSECLVTEERNDIYTAELTYPTTGALFNKLAEGMYIVMQVADGSLQRFKIRKKTVIDNRVELYLQHISYDLTGIPVLPFEATGVKNAFSKINEQSVVPNPFTFWTDNASTAKYKIEVPTSCKAMLGGTMGSILQTYNGEYEWDNLNVKFWKQRGTEKNIIIRYGKDITDLVDEVDGTDAITGLLPFYKTDLGLVVGDIVRPSADYEVDRIQAEDVTTQFGYLESLPSKAQVTSAGNRALINKTLSATQSIKVSFVPLWQSEEYKDTLQQLNLCDIITVRYTKLGVDRKAKVVRTVWDVLQERYESIELGDTKSSLVETLVETKKEIEAVDTKIDYAVESVYERMESENENIRQEFRAEDGVLLSRITKYEGDTATQFSQIRQDINGIETEVYNLDKEQGQLWSSISQTASQISSKVSWDDYDGNTIASLINQTSTTIQIEASKIKLTGITTIGNTQGTAWVTFKGNELYFEKIYGDSNYLSFGNVGGEAIFNLANFDRVWVDKLTVEGSKITKGDDGNLKWK